MPLERLAEIDAMMTDYRRALKVAQERESSDTIGIADAKASLLADVVPELTAEVSRLLAYLSPFQPMDPDPTPNDSEHGACGAKHPDDGNPNRCTWPVGHPERWSHVAGNGEIVTAVF